jgi:hypothetical protein
VRDPRELTPLPLRALPALRTRVSTRHCPSCECEWVALDPRCFLCGEVGLPGPYPERTPPRHPLPSFPFAPRT